MSFGNTAFEIIGIVGDIRHRALESDPAAAMYMPTYEGSMNVVIRSKGDPASLAAAVRKEVLQIDPNQPVADVRTMEQWLDALVAGTAIPHHLAWLVCPGGVGAGIDRNLRRDVLFRLAANS